MSAESAVVLDANAPLSGAVPVRKTRLGQAATVESIDT